jgi:hypothetical protein
MSKFNDVKEHDVAFANVHAMSSNRSLTKRTRSEQDIASIILFMTN